MKNNAVCVQGIKAREILHANMEKIIEEKMERQQLEDEYHDAFDYMLSCSKEHGHQLSIQELKVQGEEVDELDVDRWDFLPLWLLSR